MASVQIEAGTLTASLDERTVSGLLLPFGEVGNTNLGKFSVEPGVIKLPRDPSVVGANTDHEREQPVGRAVSLEETDEGVTATFRIADTDEGDALLMDIAEGRRTKLSAEVRNVVIRAGKAVSGALFGAAFVEKGAFPSAALMAADIGDLPEEPTKADELVRLFEEFAHKYLTPESTDEADASEEPVTPTEPEAPAEKEEEEQEMADATIPNTLAASAPVASEAVTLHEALSLFAARANGTVPADIAARINGQLTPSTSLFAAAPTLVKHSGTGAVAPYNTAPQWIGELWNGNSAKPVISDLLGQKSLISRQVAGFKFTTEPTGGDWAGNGGAIVSSAMATTTTTYTASYFAGANSFSREFTDFGVTEPLMSHYLNVQARNFTLWLDALALAGIQAGLTSVEADNPTGLAIGAGFSALIDGATQVISNVGQAPSFALVDAAVYKEMLKMPQQNILGYLNAALGLEAGDLSGFQIRPVPTAKMNGNLVILGVKEAADVYTLAGSPVRAEALQVATGQIDVGLYGYGLFVPNLASGFVGVTVYTA